jgi:uncharacterized phage protein gp47/JayE
MELETVYHEIDMILDETFMETASKDGLVKIGNQLGVPLEEATFAHFIGEFDVDVEIGSRFNSNKFSYNVINKLSEPYEGNPNYTCELVCETAGSEPNDFLGEILPITYVENLTYANLKRVIIYGEDEEETESYRYRLQVHVNNPPTDGNTAQYNEWLDEYDGIGKYQVLPCWNGQNTIKLVVLNSENKRASAELIASVQDYFDPPSTTINDDVNDSTYPQGRGMGNGKALIGAIVTVDTATEVPVKIECELKLKEGYSAPVGVEEAVDDYLNSLVLNKYTVGYMPISARIYNAESVEDVLSLKINIGNTVMDADITPFIDSVTIGANQIAVLDTENSVWGVR